MIQLITFYLFAGFCVLSALKVVFSRNAVHSVLALIFCFFNAAILFLMLGAEFLAFILIIVYVGAVAVLFLFVVMMLNVKEKSRNHLKENLPMGLVIGLIMLAQLIYVGYSWQTNPEALTLTTLPQNTMTITETIALDENVLEIDESIAVNLPLSNTEALAHVLYTHYLVLFQIAGIILLIAMISAITLTLRRRPGTRRQTIHKQVNTDPEAVVTLQRYTTKGDSV